MQSYSEPCSFSGQRCAVHCKEHRSNKKIDSAPEKRAGCADHSVLFTARFICVSAVLIGGYLSKFGLLLGLISNNGRRGLKQILRNQILSYGSLVF